MDRFKILLHAGFIKDHYIIPFLLIAFLVLLSIAVTARAFAERMIKR